MKKYILFLLLIIPTLVFGQITRRTITASNSTQLDGKGITFFVDTLTNQNIFGLKVVKDDLVLDSTLSIGVSSPDGTAILDITSTTKGLLPPRMTDTQRDAISTPAEGLQVHDNVNNVPNFFDGTNWRRFAHTTTASLEEGGVVISESSNGSALITDSANFFWDNTNKRLGIGTTVPGAKLDVNGDVLIGGNDSLVLPYSGYTGQNPATLQISKDVSTSSTTDFAGLILATKQAGTANMIGTIYFNNQQLPVGGNRRIAQIAVNTDGATNSGKMDLAVWSGGTPVTAITILNTGNVGIGTMTPDNTLDIDGFIEYDNKAITLGSGVTTFAATANGMTVTGHSSSNTIATITGVTNGGFLTLIFTNNKVTITDDDTHGDDSIDLNASFTSADDVVIRLEHDGTSWYEVSRSTN